MHDWEISAWDTVKQWEKDREAGRDVLDHAAVMGNLRTKREEIFERLCTPKKRVYLRVVSYGQPPEYDHDMEKIDTVTPKNANRIVIRTRIMRHVHYLDIMVALRPPAEVVLLVLRDDGTAYHALFMKVDFLCIEAHDLVEIRVLLAQPYPFCDKSPGLFIGEIRCCYDQRGK